MVHPIVISRFLGIMACSAVLCAAQENITLEAIEVQANTVSLEERKENSIAKRIIGGEELTQYGDLNALEILKRLPSVTIPEGKAKKGAPGKGYTIILIDGEEASAGSRRRANPLEQISPDMIERIEVMTNGSAEYTAESMGGIVNVVLKKPKAEGRVTIKATGGAYGDSPMASVFAQKEGRTGDLSYLVNLTVSDNQVSDTSTTHTEDVVGGSYTDKHRTGELRDRNANLTTKLIYSPTSKDKYTFDGTVALSETRNRIDTLGYTDGAAAADTVQVDRDKSQGTMVWAKLKGEHHISGNELVEWKLKYHQNDDNGDSSSVQTLPSLSTKTQTDEGTFWIAGAEGAYSVVAGDHFVKIGGEYKHLSQDDDVRRTLDGVDITTASDSVSFSEDRGAVYIQDEVTIGESLILTPGLRYESVSRDFGNTSNLNYLAPSVHLLYKLSPDDNLRASVAKTVRLPRLSEVSTTINSTLDQNDIHYPDQTGNPDLKEEKALSYELRYEHFFGDKGVASAGGFYRTISDKIEKLITYEFNPDYGTYRYVERPYNIGEGNLWGVELELKTPLDGIAEGLNLTANATLQNSSLTNSMTGDTRPIRQTSNALYNIALDHNLKAYRFTYGAAYRYVGGYDDPVDDYGFAESMKGYGTLDLYANKRLSDTYKLGLNLKNVMRRNFEITSMRYDPATGILQEIQSYDETSKMQVLLTLEGKW